MRDEREVEAKFDKIRTKSQNEIMHISVTYFLSNFLPNFSVIS